MRSSLYPGLLKTLACNRHMALPLRLFEVSDVVLKDDARDVRARNERRLAAMFCGRASGFEVGGMLMCSALSSYCHAFGLIIRPIHP